VLTDLLPEDPNNDDRTKIPAADLRAEMERLERGKVDYPSTYATHPIDALLAALDAVRPRVEDDAVVRAINALKAVLPL
jgi:hypothetical protein